jgi:hypothetical protein
MVGTKSMLDSAMNWAKMNITTLPNAENYILAFQNMASSSDINEIRTTGSSYYRGMTMGRVTSNDAVLACMAYEPDMASQVYKSFTSTNPKLEKDEEENKKA